MSPRTRRLGNKFTIAFQASLNADAVEQASLAGTRTSSEASLLSERISGETGDEPSQSQIERSEHDSLSTDIVAGAVSDELYRRSKIPGCGYPFTFDGKSLAYIGSKTMAYEFCLAVSRADTITQGDFVRLPRNFERLSTIAARLYLGEGAEGIRLGWPTDTEDVSGHPTDFLGRANLLRSYAPVDSEEWNLAPTKDFQKSVSNAKDHGMDFIAWKPFPDERLGRLTLLGQCACGRNDQDSDTKAKELDFPTLKTIFRTLTWLDPLRVFATPYHINEPDRFKRLHALPNMVFDRARISAVCELRSDDKGLALLRSRIKKLTEAVFGKIKISQRTTTALRTKPGKRTTI